MRTQYKLNLLLWLFACLLCAGGCQRDETMPEGPGSMVNLGLNLGTYALGDDDTNALLHEKQIRSLYVFIYNGDGLLENPGKTKVTVAGGGPLVDASGRINASWKVYEGQKTVYVVANVPETLKTISGSTAAADVLNAPTLAVLKDLCTDADRLYDDYSLNQGANWKGGLMSGSTTIAVTKTISEVTVPLTRRYARIDLAVKKSTELASATVRAVKLQPQNYSPSARLLALSSEWGGSRSESLMTSISQTLTSDYIRVRPKTTGGVVEYELYVMPKPMPGGAGVPVALQLDVEINGKTESYTIYLAQTAADGTQDPKKPLAIQANKIYKVNATLSRRSTDVDITIKDWDDKAIQGDIAGTYLGFSETKIKMDWWALGQTFKANVDYLSDGTVSFVGYVLKNANGTDKSVTTDGTNMPAWLNAGSISGLPDGTTTKGTFTAEYRVVAGPNPDVYLRFKTGNVIKDIQFVCDNGFIPKADLKSQGWPEDLLPSVGIQVAKRGNINPDYDALATDPKVMWATLTRSIHAAQATGYGVGLSNTNAAIAALGTNPLYSAAAKCRALGPDWYLMSRDEEAALYGNRFLMSDLSYSFTDLGNGGGYWTSSEADRDAGQYSYFIYFNDGGRADTNEKTNPNMKLRCVRSIDAIKLSTNVLYADYAAWGNSFTTTVDYESSAGNVRIWSFNNVGTTKNWVTAAYVSGGTSGKLTVTYTPTNSATHDDVVIVLSTSTGLRTYLIVKYDNGLIPASALPAEWTLNRPGVGLQIAKKGNNLPSGTADANWDKELIQWSTTTTSVPNAKSEGYGYGVFNTSAIITALGSAASAANKCRSLSTDWYFSSRDELGAIYNNQTYLGTSYLFDANYYSSATETRSDYSWYVLFTNGSTSFSHKTNRHYVRCVKDIDPLKLSKTQLTADYINWGNSFSTDVNFTSDDGAVSVVSIDNTGATKDWLISAVVSGSTSGKITVTYRPTEGNNGVHSDVVITVKTAGGVTKTLTVQYDNGLIPVSAIPITWGTLKAGFQMAKMGNNLPSGVADANWDKESMQLATTTTSVPNAQQTGYGYGAANTTVLSAFLGSRAIAANKCRSLGSDWYLPSLSELTLALSRRKYLGSSYSFNAYYYWSSSENNSDFSGFCWYVYFDTSSSNYSNKTYNRSVRCVKDL